MVVPNGVYLEVLKDPQYIVVEARTGISQILTFVCGLQFVQVPLPIEVSVSRGRDTTFRV